MMGLRFVLRVLFACGRAAAIAVVAVGEEENEKRQSVALSGMDCVVPGTRTSQSRGLSF